MNENNFKVYIDKIKQSLDSCRTQFYMAREFCGHRDEYEHCKHLGNRMTYANTYCKMKFCPLLKSTS
jgi:hypothetical protein